MWLPGGFWLGFVLPSLVRVIALKLIAFSFDSRAAVKRCRWENFLLKKNPNIRVGALSSADDDEKDLDDNP